MFSVVILDFSALVACCSCLEQGLKYIHRDRNILHHHKFKQELGNSLFPGLYNFLDLRLAFPEQLDCLNVFAVVHNFIEEPILGEFLENIALARHWFNKHARGICAIRRLIIYVVDWGPMAGLLTSACTAFAHSDWQHFVDIMFWAWLFQCTVQIVLTLNLRFWRFVDCDLSTLNKVIRF